MAGYTTHAQFHGAYLKRMLAGRGLTYSKTNPKAVTETSYLKELIHRADHTGHLPTFKAFVDFCRKVEAEM